MSQLECDDVKCPIGGHGVGQTVKTRLASAALEEPKLQLHLSKVRDYRDKFILHQLQSEARMENPGFLYLIEGKEKAKIIWAENGKGRVPAGYYIYGISRREFSKHAHEVVQFPNVFSQVYVCPGFRRKGAAMRMMLDFIHGTGGDVIWVESPKLETQALLNKLGYFEPPIPYELWQMMEGLSRWIRIEDLVIRAKLVPESDEDLRVWRGDAFIDLKALR